MEEQALRAKKVLQAISTIMVVLKPICDGVSGFCTRNKALEAVKQQ